MLAIGREAVVNPEYPVFQEDRVLRFCECCTLDRRQAGSYRVGGTHKVRDYAPFADGSFDTRRNDTVRPSSW